MHKTLLKAHKGIDSKLIFKALGPDRAPVDISCNQQVYARIIDPENKKVVLEKLCRLGPAKGIITLELNSGDVAAIHSGIYNIVLVRTENFVSNVPDYYIEKPIFSDFDNNISMEIEITEQAYKTPKESVILTEQHWTPDLIMPVNGPRIPCFYSSSIHGARVENHRDSVHSFSVYTENFTGVLQVWGTLEESPGPQLNDKTWFKIYPSTMSTDIEYIGYTGTQAWTFSANFMWLKFRYIPSIEVADPGKLVKLIVRT